MAVVDSCGQQFAFDVHGLAKYSGLGCATELGDMAGFGLVGKGGRTTRHGQDGGDEQGSWDACRLDFGTGHDLARYPDFRRE